MDELIELKERLTQIAITGLKSIQNDFRLKKLLNKLEILSKNSKVFDKIFTLISKLLENASSDIFSEAINLVNAVLYTSGIYSSNETKKPIKLLESNLNKSDVRLTYSELNNIRSLLKGNTSGMWSTLKEAYDNNRLCDYRLLNDFLSDQILSNSYSYSPSSFAYYSSEKEEKFNIVTILSNYGDPIVSILIDKFNKTEDNIAKSNIVKIVANIGKQKYSSYYKWWICEEKNENIIYNSLKALAYDKENEDFLINYKTRLKKLQQAKYYSLAIMQSEKAHEEIKNYCLKDVDFLNEILLYIPVLNENEVIEAIEATIDKAKHDSPKSNTPFTNEYTADLKLLYALIKLTSYYDTDNIINTLIEIIESEVETQNQTQKAAVNLINRQNIKGLLYLANLKDKYKKMYAAISFIAALKVWSKEAVFDEFINICLNENKLNPDNILTKAIIDILYYYNGITGFTNQKNNIQITFKNFLDISSNEIYYNIDKLGLSNIKTGKPVEWDSRWLEYTLKNNIIELSALFIPDNLNTQTQKKLSSYYLKYLNNIKADTKETTFPLKHKGKKREEFNLVINGIILGLLKTNQKLESIKAVIYFENYINYYTYQNNIEAMFLKFFKAEDASLFDDNYYGLCHYLLERIKSKLSS